MALVSVIEGYKLLTFMFLGIALLVDIVDGTLARKYKTQIFFPNIDGKTLDTIIDYINYIFIPCIMIYKFGYLPPNFTIIIPIFIICVSLYSYVNTKLVDTSFSYIGFPSIWNVILLYLEILNFNQWLNLFIISQIGGVGVIEIFKEAIPYFLILVFVLLIITYFPGITLFLPDMVFDR